MSNVFTTYMSLKETQHALSIVEAKHVIALVRAHSQHRPLHPKEMLFAGADTLLAGAFVRSLAQCDRCFPALTAARAEQTLHTTMLLVDERHLFSDEDRPASPESED